MTLKNNLLIPAIVVFLLAFIFKGGFIPSDIEFRFYVNGTEEPVEGDVYLSNALHQETQFLGVAENGRLSVNPDKLSPGEICLNGTYKGRSFGRFYGLNSEDLSRKRIDFVIEPEYLEALLFNSSDIDTEEIEAEIFRLINDNRTSSGISPLKRSPILDEIAQEYSADMAKRDFFSHNTPEGLDIQDRLKLKEVFYYSSAEDLFYASVKPDTNVSEETVSGWMSSPGHRIPIMDTNKPIIWDHAGIGITCIDIDNGDGLTPVCYITAEFADFETTFNESLSEGFLQFIYLYNPNLGLDYPADLQITFSSDEDVNLYVVPDEAQYRKCLYRLGFEKMIECRNINSYQDTINIKPGYGLIIDASNSHDVEYSLSFVYNPETG